MASNNSAYITALGAFLPNDPVKNTEMEARLGWVNQTPSRYRERVLEANGIKRRFYAIDEQGRQTHLNEDLAASAIQAALANRGYALQRATLLAAGTTLPDLLVPGFAAMLHGRLGSQHPMEILSASGVCVASMAALKAACNAVRLGEHEVAIASGSEIPSVFLRGSRFEKESLPEQHLDLGKSYQYFNADFLRWMLSDGAGAAIIENKPNPSGLSLKVEWISLQSYAHKYTTCMYMGTTNPDRPAVGNTYQSFPVIADADHAGVFMLRQDTDLLPVGLQDSVLNEAARLCKAGKIIPDEIDHFLPHISSMYFHDDLVKAYAEIGMPIPQEKWFTNLTYKGNTGAASIFIMLEEAFNEGRIQAGDKVLCMIPESGRFSISYMLLTCE